MRSVHGLRLVLATLASLPMPAIYALHVLWTPDGLSATGFLQCHTVVVVNSMLAPAGAEDALSVQGYRTIDRFGRYAVMERTDSRHR